MSSGCGRLSPPTEPNNYGFTLKALIKPDAPADQQAALAYHCLLSEQPRTWTYCWCTGVIHRNNVSIMMWEMNEEDTKKWKKYSVLFHYHYAKDSSFGYEVPVSCMEHGSSTPLIWIDDTTNKQVLHAEYSEIETTFYEVGDTIYAKKIISLLKRVGIIIDWVGNEDDLFGDNTKTPHKSRGPFKSRQYDAHVEPLTEWMYTWNAKYKSPQNIKQGKIRATYVRCVTDTATWKTPRLLAAACVEWYN